MPEPSCGTARWVSLKLTRLPQAQPRSLGRSRLFRAQRSSAVAIRSPRSRWPVLPIASRTSRRVAAHRWSFLRVGLCQESQRSRRNKVRIPFIAGNWKMYKTVHEAAVFIKELRNLVKDVSEVE